MLRPRSLLASLTFSSTPLQGIAGAVVALALVGTSPARAQFVCTTTPSDMTCTNSGTTNVPFFNTANGPNQNATTTNSGTADLMQSQTNGGGNATAINSGTAGPVQSITTAGGNATVTNSGFATNAVAETLGGGNAAATNTGTNTGILGAITNAGGTATAVNYGFVGTGIEANAGPGGGNVLALNAGSTAGGTSASTFNGTATVINSGSNANGLSANSTVGTATVVNTGSNAAGGITVLTFNGNGTVINTGTNGGGILALANGIGNANVFNAGTTSGTVRFQALGVGSQAFLVNSGVISNFGGTAIQFVGGPDTLTLLPGSIIIGGINLVGTNDTINVLSGNQNLTFNTLAGATVSGTVPFVVSGNQLVSIDPTPFGLADRNLMDFTRAISGMLDSIGGGVGPNGPISSAFAPSEPGSFAARVEQTFAAIPALAYGNDQAMVFKAPTMVTSDGRAVWARGFGGERRQDPDGVLLGASTTFFGGAVGFDILARPDLRLGLFAGGGQSSMSLELNQGHTRTDTGFGGVYGRWGFVSWGLPSFLDFALHGGGSTSSTSRPVNNNTIAGGIEIATASYASSYISPELRYGVNVPLWAQYTLTPSLRVRYVAGFFGGYTETATTAPLTVSSRIIQDIEERGELKLTRATPVGPDLLLTSVHIGAIALERAGDTTVNAVLLGATLPFVTPGKNDVAGIVGGGGFEWRTHEGVSLFGAGEAIGFSDQSTVWSARGGVRVAF